MVHKDAREGEDFFLEKIFFYICIRCSQRTVSSSISENFNELRSFLAKYAQFANFFIFLHCVSLDTQHFCTRV